MLGWLLFRGWVTGTGDRAGLIGPRGFFVFGVHRDNGHCGLVANDGLIVPRAATERSHYVGFEDWFERLQTDVAKAIDDAMLNRTKNARIRREIANLEGRIAELRKGLA